MAKSKTLAPVEEISRTIIVLRRQRIILDADLAALYGVTTKRLNEQVKRNAERFPEDFMFRLTRAETETLNRSHFATGSQKHRDPRFPPYAFTEHGAIMAAMILNSPCAVEMSVYVVRAFVKLRELLASNRELACRFEQLEARVEKLVAHDQALGVILSAIRKLMPLPPEPPQNRPIGFTADLEEKS
jgi:ORF6N domain